MTSFPVVDRYLLDHPFAFCLILSTIEAKLSLFRRPKCSGSPRYFPTPLSFGICRMSLTVDFNCPGVLLEKEIEDFAVLMDFPDAHSYRRRRSLRVLLLSLVASIKNIVSSANNRWLTRGQPLATLIPFMVPFAFALIHSPESTSLHKMKMYGESGSP